MLLYLCTEVKLVICCFFTAQQYIHGERQSAFYDYFSASADKKLSAETALNKAHDEARGMLCTLKLT